MSILDRDPGAQAVLEMAGRGAVSSDIREADRRTEENDILEKSQNTTPDNSAAPKKDSS